MFNSTSVRIESNKFWNGGLFILDLNRAPWGCGMSINVYIYGLSYEVYIGVWPAFWSLGATAAWPQVCYRTTFNISFN